jgi:hypothetical protein
MAFRKYFVQTLKSSFPVSYESLIERTDEYYRVISADTAFSKNSQNPLDRRLDFCAYFLAMISALDEQGETFETIRKNCLTVAIAFVRPKNRIHAWIKKMIPKLAGTPVAAALLRSLNRKLSRNSNPDGFIANIITDKSETYGFGYGVDILVCGICKLFGKYQYSRFTPILCEVDEITSRISGLTLVRSGTIANGAKKCDFRFKKSDKKPDGNW